ncbi:hypothetical protein BC941DRAFT_420604, partial [Chlamydoabsidia padenii]
MMAGFKIDLRFIYDSKDRQQYEVGAGEATKTSHMDKLTKDLGKLTREGKDVLHGWIRAAD